MLTLRTLFANIQTVILNHQRKTMTTTISPTIAQPATSTEAIILVPIATLDAFLPLWTRAIMASAMTFVSRADDPSLVEVTIGRGFATWQPGMGCWLPTAVEPFPLHFPHWMDSPSLSA
jgi:hypothetical protein